MKSLLKKRRVILFTAMALSILIGIGILRSLKSHPEYETIGLLFFAALSIAPAVPGLFLLVRYLRTRDAALRKATKRQLGLTLPLAAIIYAGVCIDAFLLEPNWVQINHIRVTASVEKPLRILHLSDLHLENSLKPRDEWLLKQVDALQPDLILLTGDLHQTDNYDVPSIARVLGKLKAPLGVYTCIGYDTEDLLQAAAPQIQILKNDTRVLQNGPDTIGLAGFLGGRGKHQSYYDAIAECDLRIVLNHTPDLADEAAEQGVNLYLCGHTHGGQVRIPFWGAIITNSATGKRFESGRYRVADTTIYTSRGLGLEPRPAPQVRFFCRPEITLITIEPG